MAEMVVFALFSLFGWTVALMGGDHKGSQGMQQEQTVLIVDDDISIRSVLRELLHFAGYTVMECADADQALAVIDEAGGAISVMFADYALPGMNGLALAREVRRVASWVQTVIISGHGHIQAECRRDPMFRFLAKPFGTADVLRAISATKVPQPFCPKGIRSDRPLVRAVV